MIKVEWCNICNSRPADGRLAVIIEGVEEELDACTPCVYDKDKVEFI